MPIPLNSGFSPATLAIAEGATTPSSGYTSGDVVFSTSTLTWMRWTGALWTAAANNDKQPGGLTAQTNSGLSMADLLLSHDVSDVTQGTGGSLKKMTELAHAQGLRILLTNYSTVRVLNAAGSTDGMLTGSNIVLPGAPLAGTSYRCKWDISKTNVGTATPIVTVRVGTSGTGAVTDTARLVFTFGAGTAVAEVAGFEVECYFRNVGGSAAVLVGLCTIKGHLSTTGISNAKRALAVVSSAFDESTAVVISTSYNGGTAAVHTSEFCRSELAA